MHKAKPLQRTQAQIDAERSNPYINIQVTPDELDLIREAVLALRPERQSLELDEYLEI